MYIYELIKPNGTREDTCVTFKEKQFRDFILGETPGVIEVSRADDPKHVFYRIYCEDDLNNFTNLHPDAIVRAQLNGPVRVVPPSNDDLPDRNLKTIAAIGKPDIMAVPAVAFFALGAAMADGMKKYGLFNWRKTGATVSVFEGAIFRHFTEYFRNRQNYARDSRIHHLAHMMASCAILLDAELQGCLNDDRGYNSHEMMDVEEIMKLVKTDTPTSMSDIADNLRKQLSAYRR